jgi:tetratricopeptide (TPR) repeat protein
MDRAATMRQAEKLLRQGRLDQAIAEYVRLVEDEPSDWNAANQLGDLLVRAGQQDRALEQFHRVAEHLGHEGFLPRASALYKKILKLKPDDDLALLQAGELAVQQRLPADARVLFTEAEDVRRRRGDLAGALRMIVRLGDVDRNDFDARVAGARARLQLEDVAGAVHEWFDVAQALIADGREDEAVGPLREIVAAEPGNAHAATELARILIQQGNIREGATYLAPNGGGAELDLMLETAAAQLRSGDAEIGLEMIDTLLARDASESARITAIALSLATDAPDTAYRVADHVASANIASGSWSAAADTLRQFITRAPGHVMALTRLVDVCVDGALQDGILDAQAMLADAYLASGAAAEARCVAEDLVARQPLDQAHIGRLRAALVAAGEPDPERAVNEWLVQVTTLGTADETSVPAARDAAAAPGVESPVVPVAPPPVQRDRHAIDLNLIFGRPRARAEASASAPAGPPDTSDTSDIESVFERLRQDAGQSSPEQSADVAYTRGAALFDAGALAESAEQLRTAARSPRLRFAAASLLARVYRQQKRTLDAIEWLGHAIDAPGVVDAERFDALFRLAELLEEQGEPASALAVCLELQADAGDYKGVASRIARLSRAQAGG